MSDRTDWELVGRARSGETGAFAELVERYQVPVIRFCRRMVGSQQDAEDIAQESFVRVYRHLHRLKPEAMFSTLLFGIARNLALNFIRDSKRRGRGAAQSITNDDASERPITDEALRPDRTARLREIESMLEQGLALLSPDHRAVLVLRELEGLDYDAIAKACKCRKGTVKSRLARAREQLRARLVELGGKDL